MVHALQEARGAAPKRAYHNKDFAAQMKARGLYPSNTGTVGGREVGASMSHYIVPNGAFEQSYERLRTKGWKLNLQSAMTTGPQWSRRNKTKFACPYCGATAWGKQALGVVCGLCLVESHPELADVADTYRMTQSGRFVAAADPVGPEPSEPDLQAAE